MAKGVVFVSQCFKPGDSCQLLVLAVGAAVYLAQEMDSEGMSKMAAFFTVLGDILAMLALHPEFLEVSQTEPRQTAQSSGCS